MEKGTRGAKAFVLVNVEIGQEREVLAKLKSIPGVKEAFRIYGVYDSVVKIEANDKDTLNQAVLEIRKMAGIRNTMTLLPLEGFER